MVQPVHRHRVDGADHLQHAVEVVELLEDLEDLDDPRQHGHSLVQVHRLNDAPGPQQQTHRHLSLCATHTLDCKSQEWEEEGEKTKKRRKKKKKEKEEEEEQKEEVQEMEEEKMEEERVKEEMEEQQEQFQPPDSLLEPQREVGGVADHTQQVGRVLLFVFFGPDAADQLRWPHGSAGGVKVRGHTVALFLCQVGCCDIDAQRLTCRAPTPAA